MSCRKWVSCHAPILRFPRGDTETAGQHLH
jgi:hypothetical protein